MFRRPRFKAHYHVRIVSEDETVLLWETGYRVLRSRLIAMLAPWLDGAHAVAEITAGLTGVLSPLDVSFGIEQLAEGGYLQEAEPDRNEPERAFLELLEADARLSHRAVQVRTAGKIDPNAMDSALRELEIQVSDDAELVLVITDDYLRPELTGIQEELQLKPRLLIKPVGVSPSIGPLFLPQSGPCWYCLLARLNENPEIRILRGFQRGGDEKPYSVAALAATIEAVMQLAATEAYKYLVRGAAPHLEATLVTLDVLNLETRRHALARREGCPHCSPLIQQEQSGLDSRDPDTTFHRYEKHISPITGVVAGIVPLRVPHANRMYVYSAVSNFTLQYGRKSSPARWLGSRSIGKGITSAQAKCSALCEALERYSGCWRGYEKTRMSAAENLGEAAVPIESCMLFSECQYAQREAWNGREGDYNFVPQRFDSRRSIPWVELQSLTHDRARYLPAAFCYYNVPIEDDHDFCRPDSNGNAAASSLEEAILSGFFEVVERDAVSIWWYNQARRRGVDIASFPLPFFSELLADYAKLGRKLWALDLTSDFGIPVFAAISERIWGEDEPVAGFGAHLDPTVALARACTEVNQAIAAIESGSIVRIAVGPWPSRDFLYPDPSFSPGGFDAYPNRGTEDVQTDLTHCLGLARKIGVEVLILDQTRADVGLPVAKVVMPGMRHFWARFAPGRLYKLPSPRQEAELNSAHLIL
ncbi:MAG: TOMM precursor leader peptide-binding protein [Bryobacteraceae bacterium]